MSEIKITPVPPEISDFVDALIAPHLSDTVCAVKRFGNCRQRNPNRCDGCGHVFEEGQLRKTWGCKPVQALCPRCIKQGGKR